MTEQRTETGPVTAAGRRLRDDYRTVDWLPGDLAPTVAAIEQEAWNLALAAVEAKVAGLHQPREVCERCGLPRSGLHSRDHKYVPGGKSQYCDCGLRRPCSALRGFRAAIEELRHD